MCVSLALFVQIVTDSRMSRAEALGRNHFPSRILREMEVVEVSYNGFDHKRHRGQIVVNRAVSADVKAIFAEIERTGYPITKVVPIVDYGWDDDASIADNNTSGFNYRHVMGPGQDTSALSHHAYGRAIDLNPKINPFVSRSGESPRPYRPGQPGVLTLKSPVTQIFLRHGWKWGGSWVSGKDYQHFEKMR